MPATDIRPLIIGADRVVTEAATDVRNPWDQSLLARVSLADRALLDRVANIALDAFKITSKQPPHERAEVLAKMAAVLTGRKDDFAQTIVQESGKPITLAEAEVGRAIINFTVAAEAARKTHGGLLDASAYAPGAGHAAIMRRFPAGVVYGMTPFNFPVNLVVYKLAPALAIGAPIILKPSPRTPLSTLKLAELALECGAIPGAVNVINCPNDLATHLAEDPRTRVVSFTGSAPIGWQVKAKANKKKVTLELGGNAAVIVHGDADLDLAIPAIATGAFAYAGQSCISVQRILVQRSIYDTVRDRLVAHIRAKVKTGDPTDRAVLVGPMIDAASRDRVLKNIDDAKSRGATVLTGGVAKGPCVEPTLLENVPADHVLCTEEAFAPVAVLVAYDDFDDAIALANASHFGLQAGVYTRDISRAFAAFERLDVGGVLINQPPTMRIDNLPYGGVKDSGFGREGIDFAIEEMTEPRVMIVKL